MNSFDLIIERYKKELIDAKRRSIEKELADAANEKFKKPVSLEAKEENSKSFSPASFVFKNEHLEDSLSFDEKEKITPVNAAFENAAQNAENGKEADTAKEENPGSIANETAKKQASLQIESNNLQNETLNFDEIEPYPETLGALKVQVFMANRAYPVSSAHVVIAGQKSKKVYFDGYTNTNGIVGSILLPAPKKAFSQSPQETPPYSQYDILVRHPKFQSRKYLGVPVFSGIESIQNIQLLPLGTDDEDNTDVTESEPNGLLMKGGESNG